jgi:uncharacterized lipoprotein YbaY
MKRVRVCIDGMMLAEVYATNQSCKPSVVETFSDQRGVLAQCSVYNVMLMYRYLGGLPRALVLIEILSDDSVCDNPIKTVSVSAETISVQQPDSCVCF